MQESRPIPHPVRPAPSEHDEGDDGIDVSLIRWTLSLSPQERLEVLQANADALVRLQDAAQAKR